MKRSLNFRPAGTGDSVCGAELIMMTLREFGDRFFGFGSHQRATQALRHFFMLPRSRFSYQHAVMACQGEQVVGLLLLFDRRAMYRAWLATAFHLFKVYRLGEIFQLTKMLISYQNEERVNRDELYIAHLAVFPLYRRRGFGQQLLDYAAEQAQTRSLSHLSLMTELENQPAINLYRKAGFEVVETIYYPQKQYYLGSKGSLRMCKELSA